MRGRPGKLAEIIADAYGESGGGSTGASFCGLSDGAAGYAEGLSWGLFRAVGVIGPAVLFHGTYNFALMSVSVMEGNVGWIHPNGLRNTALALGLVSGMIGLAVRKAKQEWRKVQKHEQDRLKDDESRK